MNFIRWIAYSRFEQGPGLHVLLSTASILLLKFRYSNIVNHIQETILGKKVEAET